jgi:hypothetical protein
MQTSDPHYREAAGAIAGMTETYGPRWVPRPGDRVRCPRAFGGGYQDGTVYGLDGNVNRVGHRDIYLVDTPEGRLALFTDELERI